MKILRLTAYYEPEVAASMYLTIDVINGLIEAGDQVDVFTPIPTRGVSDAVRNQYKKRKLETKFNGNLRIFRYWLPKESRNSLSRLIRYFLGSIIHFFKALCHKTDVIYLGSTPPINGVMGAILKKMKNTPFVYCLQDIFPDSMVSAKMAGEGSIAWKIGRKVEDFTYKNADKIIVISEDFKKNIMAKGVCEDKIAVIYNWVDANSIIPIARADNELFDEFHLDRELFYVVYAGNLGNAQNIEVILQAAKRTADIADIVYLIFGNGAQEEYYKQMASEMKLSNVTFFPLQPYAKVSQVYSLGDVSIVSCKEGFGKSAMPSKTWSIMSAGTAVVASFDVDTDMQHIIEENSLGLFAAAGDAEALKDAVLTLYNDRTLCRRMGERGRQYILENLTREIGTKKYIDTIHFVKR